MRKMNVVMEKEVEHKGQRNKKSTGHTQTSRGPKVERKGEEKKLQTHTHTHTQRRKTFSRIQSPSGEQPGTTK
jgi:hypothetical protein